MRINFLVLGILSLMVSCKQQNSPTPQVDSKYFSENYELAAFNHGTLLIRARFSECGEWGGHQEKISIDIYKDMSLKAHYQVYPFNCDSIGYYYYTAKSLIPVIDKTVVLKEEGQKAISDYIQRLMHSKLREKFPGHAGNVFSLNNSDSSLVIEVYDNKEEDVKSYKQLVAALFDENTANMIWSKQ